jgi:hypothetical protein
VDRILGSTFEEEKETTESAGDAAVSGIPDAAGVLTGCDYRIAARVFIPSTLLWSISSIGPGNSKATAQ